MKTFNEIERAAYMAGNTQLADLAHESARFWVIEENSELIDFNTDVDKQVKKAIKKAIAEKCPDYEAYKQFFEECFYRLNGHYPAPSVTSDYDCSVIFDAIEKGGAE